MFPEKGSGIFWHNLYRSNYPDNFTRHKACTILLGNKWIGNKWIGYNAQWNGTMCDLSPHTKFAPISPYDWGIKRFNH